jgi:DNA polymerase III subunit epsilon
MPRVAVLDVETTGLNPYRYDRVIEIAVVVMEPEGGVCHEFVSLVNPERDIGPTSVHGLTSRDVVSAPRFGEVAGLLVSSLRGCVALAGHNVRFDHAFLSTEFARIGYAVPDIPTVCTMRMAGGGTLARCCSCLQVEFNQAESHCALHDARATAHLLALLLREDSVRASQLRALAPLEWPSIPASNAHVLTREAARTHQAKAPTYLQRLGSRLEMASLTLADDSVAMAYAGLLDRVLEDRFIDEREQDDLIEVASRWGLSVVRIAQIHREYLQRLAMTALADGVVTEAETRDLALVASLLGIDDVVLDDMLSRLLESGREVGYAAHETQPKCAVEQLVGKRVCFTGELSSRLQGKAISRNVATDLATEKGMIVVDSVTKALDFLVVADPLTQSGKAKKARKYGTRIVQEAVFWSMLGIRVE